MTDTSNPLDKLTAFQQAMEAFGQLGVTAGGMRDEIDMLMHATNLPPDAVAARVHNISDELRALVKEFERQMDSFAGSLASARHRYPKTDGSIQ